MKRKTVNSILKGVAGVGLTLGGVSALSDANLVFASEVEQPEQETSTEEAVVVEETSEEGKVDLETYEYDIADDNDNIISSMSAAAYDMQNAVKEAQESVDDATSTDADDQAVADDGTVPDADVPEDENGSGGENKDEEDPLKTAQDDVDRLVAEAREAGAAKGKDGKVNYLYYKAADKLVQEMVKYYAEQEGFNSDQVDVANWVSKGIDNDNNYVQNYLKVTYTSGDFQDVVYYDYVNADANGEILTGTKYQDNTTFIDHIVIVEKTPIFADDDASGLFTFDRDDFRNITAYKVNDVEIKVGTEEDDEFVVETTVTGNNASGYTVTKKTTKKADQSEETTSKTYSVLKKFVDKGRVYYKESKADESNDTETPDEPVVTEDTDYTYTPGPSEPSTPASPQPETPAAEIEDEDVPLADVPDVADEDIDTDDDLEEDLDEDVTDLEDEDVPLAVLDLDEPVDIPDADVPLSDNPETGDALTATWIGTAAASVAGLFGASRKKRKG